MIGARALLAGVVVLAWMPAAADPPEPLVTCRAGVCEADLPPGSGDVRVCIDDALLGEPRAARAPEVVGDKPQAMRRDGRRWCAVVARTAPFTIRAGKRTLRVVLVAPVPAEPALPKQGWVDLGSLSEKRMQVEQVQGEETRTPERVIDAILRRGTEGTQAIGERTRANARAPTLGERTGATETTQALGERTQVIGEGVPVTTTAPAGQPVPAPAIGLDSLPDDLAFLDVVAVGDDRSIHCTGIALTRDAILTAAHCVPATHVDLAVQTSEVLRTARVRDTIVHPALDVAVLRLETPLPVIIRPRRHASDAAPPKGILRAVGFGVDDPRTGGGFGIKRRADITAASWGCDAGRNVTTGCRMGAEMVIAALGGRDTCAGDSGGPVLEPFGDTWRLIAITSRPTSNAGSACGHGGIYVRVDAIDGWLSQALEDKQ